MNDTLPNESEVPVDMHKHITIFLGGDVMTGRGIDQILPHPGDPLIHEPYMKNARGYVEIAEKVNGPVPTPVNFSYIWGDALAELKQAGPDVRMVNLETSITGSDDYWYGKDIHYRMHPDNMPCLTAAKIDVCTLANNHVLDWGYKGLSETLKTLKQANVKIAGAGQNLEQAETPAVIQAAGKGRVLIFSFGTTTSGIPFTWAAEKKKPGVHLLRALSNKTVRYIKEMVRKVKRKGDIVIASIHWGSNWGYQIPREQTEFAHKLIDSAGIDVIHGHSSHHVRPVEVYEQKPVIYGCGDLLNDYEGIGGYETFRGDLALMYFISMNPDTGSLVSMQMTPMKIKNFRLNRVSEADAMWLKNTLNRECKKFGSRVELKSDNSLILHW